jgi:hypothetical protein
MQSVDCQAIWARGQADTGSEKNYMVEPLDSLLLHLLTLSAL